MPNIPRSIKRILLKAAAFCAVLLVSLASLGMTQNGSPLSQSIALFEQGQDTAALSALNEVVRQNPHTPLAYYYAARIRIRKGQFDRALANLERALQDSTEFYDVHSYRAVAYREMGDTANARRAWQTFVGTAGILDGVDATSLDAIMPPDEYHQLLAVQEQQKREEEQRAREEAERLRRLQQEQETKRREQATADSLADIQRRARATADSLSAAQATADSIAALQAAASSPAPEPPAPKNESAESTDIQEQPENAASSPALGAGDVESEAGLSIDDTPLKEIENQISADIRSIVYWFAGIAILFLAGFGVMLGISHRRRKKGDEKVFSEQVERLLDDMQFEVNENQAISDFDQKRQEIAEEIATLQNDSADSEQALVPEIEPATSEPAFSAPAVKPAPDTRTNNEPERASTHKSLITEEVKTLVSRLAREGTPPAEIARTADLTVTEVNLILAVRERRIKNIATDIHHEEDTTQRDQLMSAITSLQNEGANSREIARKLDISLSEVELALSITALKQQSHHNR